MGPFSTAVLIGCLQAMKYFLWALALLLVILVFAQWYRGEPTGKLIFIAIGAVLSLVGGTVSGFAAAWIDARDGRP
ncbi:MAG: hypothetical protein JWN93_1233 [Hyphomicrobiales bacterium]|nr:hypothetical protein [Hyphomicrobiales bacterium]